MGRQPPKARIGEDGEAKTEKDRAGPDDLDYLADMLAQLAMLSRHSEQEFLAYLIDMARLEAEWLCGRQPPGGDGATRAN